MSEPDSQTLPLFPLELVLVPGELLPLHIFEERYKRMIGQARDTDGPIGIVLKLGNGVAAVGCSARLIEVLEEFPDGRMNVVVRGESAFRLLELVFPEEPDVEPLSASVEFLEEAWAEVPADLLVRAQRLAERVIELNEEPSEMMTELGAEPLEELEDSGEEPDGLSEEPSEELAGEAADSAPGTAFALAADVNLEVTFKQRLLQLTNEAERLQLLANYLDTLVARMEVLRERRDAIRGNGKGY